MKNQTEQGLYEAQEPVAWSGRTIELKTDAPVFQDVIDGRKPFELRFDDRGYQIGDDLLLRETQHSGAEIKAGAPLIYTGRQVTRRIGYILRGPIYGLADGWVVAAFAAAPQVAPAVPEGWRDFLRRSGANTDYHGLIAFSASQLEAFVAMIAAAPATPSVAGNQAQQVGMQTGWLVENGKQGDELRYRTWQDGFSSWTADPNEATRYCRRIDAENVHQEDEDAWRIVEHVWHDMSVGTSPVAQERGLRSVLKIVQQAMLDNDNSPSKTHPWIPGFDALRIKPLVDAALAAPQPDAQSEDADYRRIAALIGSIYFYGDFKAETHNERELEALLRKVGMFFESEDALIAAMPK